MRKIIIPKEILEEFYIDQKKTTLEIGKQLNIHASTVERRLKENNIPVDPDKFKKGKPLSEETKAKMKGRVPWNKGKKHTLKTRKKISEKAKIYNKGENNPMYGKHHSFETRIKISEIRQKWKNPWLSQMNYIWNKDPERRKKSLKALIKKPNKKEKILIDLFKEKNLPYIYVGNGEIIIGTFNPDFINNNGQKKIIELFGDYWHRNDDPNRRMEYFRKYGFKTLVIWENELKDLDKVLGKIQDFDNL